MGYCEEEDNPLYFVRDEATVCDGCGADEGTLSVYCANGDAYCCRACQKGDDCACGKA